MPYKDIIKQRTAQREHLRKKVIENPRWYNELKKQRKHKRESIHAIINYIKTSVGCLMCDEKDHDKLQFHHVLPSFKVATVSQLISNRSKLLTILKEIDKCVCVCTACHKQLDNNVCFVIKTVKKEKWFRDWGLKESLEWFQMHPQSRSKKNDFLNIIKAVVRNAQISDFKKFNKLLSDQ